MSPVTPDPDDPARTEPGPEDVVGAELREVFAATRPADPSDSSWGRVGRVVAAELPRPGSPWRTLGWAAAAGIVLAVGAVATWPGGRAVPEDDDPADAAAPLAVLPAAHDGDVEIHRVRPGGWKVAVGTSPVPDAITWAGPRDVRITASIPDDVFGSEPRMGSGVQAVPVIWADDSQNDKDK